MRILVTRPEPGASATARRLADLGHEAVVLPLTETRPLEVAKVPDPAELDAVVVTSASALRHAPAHLLRGLVRLPLLAVGDSTAEAGRREGFARVESAGGDGPALAALVARNLPARSRIGYLCGRVRSGALEERLTASGYVVSVLETYDTLPVDLQPEAAAAALGERPVDAALLYSANAAALLSRLMASRAVGAQLRSARLLCISRRTAEALSGTLAGGAETATRPNEEALLALIGPVG